MAKKKKNKKFKFDFFQKEKNFIDYLAIFLAIILLFNFAVNYSRSGNDDNPQLKLLKDISQSTDGSGYVTFTVELFNLNNEATNLKIEYSDDNGNNFYDAELVSAAPDNGVLSLDNNLSYQIGGINQDDLPPDTDKLSLTIVWDTKSDANGNGSLDQTKQDDIKIRITPKIGAVQIDDSTNEPTQDEQDINTNEENTSDDISPEDLPSEESTQENQPSSDEQSDTAPTDLESVDTNELPSSENDSVSQPDLSVDSQTAATPVENLNSQTQETDSTTVDQSPIETDSAIQENPEPEQPLAVPADSGNSVASEQAQNLESVAKNNNSNESYFVSIATLIDSVLPNQSEETQPTLAEANNQPPDSEQEEQILNPANYAVISQNFSIDNLAPQIVLAKLDLAQRLLILSFDEPINPEAEPDITKFVIYNPNAGIEYNLINSSYEIKNNENGEIIIALSNIDFSFLTIDEAFTIILANPYFQSKPQNGLKDFFGNELEFLAAGQPIEKIGELPNSDIVPDQNSEDENTPIDTENEKELEEDKIDEENIPEEVKQDEEQNQPTEEDQPVEVIPEEPIPVEKFIRKIFGRGGYGCEVLPSSQTLQKGQSGQFVIKLHSLDEITPFKIFAGKLPKGMDVFFNQDSGKGSQEVELIVNTNQSTPTGYYRIVTVYEAMPINGAPIDNFCILNLVIE